MTTVSRRFIAAAISAALVMVSQQGWAACISGGTLSNIDDCITAANKGGNECLLVWHVDNDGAGNPPLDPNKGTVTKGKIVCTDGDTCDRDGIANGVCTFHVGACINATGTPTNGNACANASLTNFSYKKPNDKDVNNAIKYPEAVYVQRLLDDEVGALLPSGATVCTSENLVVKVPLGTKKGTCNSPVGLKCTGDAECDDYCVLTTKKGKQIIKATVDDGGSNKDTDALKFFCLPAAAGVQVAEAIDLDTGMGATAADLIGGPLAQGRLDVGDKLLRNGVIRVIVRGPGREGGATLYQEGGHIIDADLVRENPADDLDSWMGVQTLIDVGSTQATDTVSVTDPGTTGDPAVVSSSGDDTLVTEVSPDVAIYSAGNTLSIPLDVVDVDRPYHMTTDYLLKGSADYVQVKTTIQNNGASDAHVFVGEYLNPGGQLEPFGPGLGFGDAQLRLGGTFFPASTYGQTLDYMAFQGVEQARGVTYGTVFEGQPEGALRTSMFHQSGVFVWVNDVSLLPMLNSAQPTKPQPPLVVPGMGGQNSFRRWFVVGETVADVTRARAEIHGVAVGAIQGTITVAGQPVANAHVVVTKGLVPNALCLVGTTCTNVYSATLTDDHGFYRIVLPADPSYKVLVRAEGTPYDTNTSTPTSFSAPVKKKKTTVVNVDLPATGHLQVLVKDQSNNPLPAKVSIVGIKKSPDPLTGVSPAGFIDIYGRLFGHPIDNKVDMFGLVDVKFADLTGDTGTFDIEPGNYHVVVSHGPEYDAYATPITVVSGANPTINAVLTQVVDTTGFVSIDTHVHALDSPDSAVSREARVNSMLAEGVDFFASTDHGFVADYTSIVSAMGASSRIKTTPSEEITTFSYGHFNVWPRTLVPGDITNGALDWGRADGFPSGGVYDFLPGEIFGSFNPATQVIQINHFNSGTLGNFNNLGIDTESIPPVSSNAVYRCTGTPQAATTPRAGMPCQPAICIGGADDGLDCTGGCPGGACTGAPPVGRDCPGSGGSVCALAGVNLGSLLRMDPAVANLYDDGYTALELLIEANRSQTDLALHDNLGDWAGLLNQGKFKTAIADSDSHTTAIVQAGGPRTFVASATDSPNLLDANTLAATVNAGRAIGTDGPFMTVELVGLAGAKASHKLGSPLTVEPAAGAGANSINVHVEAPVWAQFDTIDIYVNAVPTCVSGVTFFGVIDRECDLAPTYTINFAVPAPSAGFLGGQRLVKDVSQPVTITQDSWVVVVVRGTDGVSKPLFPMNPQDLRQTGNGTLNALTDFGASPPWNLGEDGQLAVAFANPLFFDFGGDNVCNGGATCP